VSQGFRLSRGHPGKWSVWKYSWLANHKIIRALERVRPWVHGTLVDIGCGSKPFARIFHGHVRHSWGIDLPDSRSLGGTRPDVFARGEALPFRDASIDAVLGTSLLSYVLEPGRLLREAHRVLRPGGTLILEFTQMAPLYDAPRDYYRFTRYGAEYLLRQAGFEPIEFIPIGGLMARVGLSATASLNRLNRGWTRILTELPVRLLYVALHLWFEGLDRWFFDPGEVLAHLVVARRATEVAGAAAGSPTDGGNPIGARRSS
jgi:SAM-dependent methyltransferase